MSRTSTNSIAQLAAAAAACAMGFLVLRYAMKSPRRTRCASSWSSPG